MAAPFDSGCPPTTPDSYCLPRQIAQAKLSQLMTEWPAAGDERFAAYRIPACSPYSDVVRTAECEVFNEFFGNNASVMHENYGPYDPHSTFLLLVDQEQQQAAGMLRIIANSARGLKTLNDIAVAPISIPLAKVLEYHRIDNLDKCWDIGTVAVMKEYRGKTAAYPVSTVIFGLLYAEFVRAGIDHGVTILDDKAHIQLTQMLGVPFVTIANSEPFSYLGSKISRASYIYSPGLEAAAAAHMKRLDNQKLRLLESHIRSLIYGEGLPKLVCVE